MISSHLRMRQRTGEPLAVLHALARQGPREEAIRCIHPFLAEPEPLVRAEAVRMLGMMGAAGVGSLLLPLSDPDASVRREAAASLGRIGHCAWPAAPALAVALEDDDLKVRTTAAHALGLIGPRAAAAVAALAEAMKSPHFILGRLAAQALSRVGLAAVPELADALETGDRYVRREAAWALGEIGPTVVADAEALAALDEEILAQALASVPIPPSAAERENQPTQAVALGERIPVAAPAPRAPRGETGGDALTALRNALQDDDAKVREAAARALTRIRGDV